MEKKPPTSAHAGAINPPSSCCERLFHAFHLQPTVRRLPFRQHGQLVTPTPPSNPPPPAAATTTTTAATTTTTAAIAKPENPSPEKQKSGQTLLSVKSTEERQQKERQQKEQQQKEQQQKEQQQKEQHQLSKGEEASGKTRRGFNLKVDEYINRTKNKMKNIGSNVGKTTTKIKE